MFISNTETGSWARFTNWYALCMTVFDGRLFFGSPSGAIYIANASGLDEGETYTGTVLPLFEDLGRSEEHTYELPSLMSISYAGFCLKKKTTETYASRSKPLSTIGQN